jgi:hypothetical protein
LGAWLLLLGRDIEEVASDPAADLFSIWGILTQQEIKETSDINSAAL